MNRIGTVVVLIVVLGVIVEDLDALKAQSSNQNGPKRMEKRRYKRFFSPYYGGGYSLSCAPNTLNFCPSSPFFQRSILGYGRAIQTIQRRRFFYNGLVSLSALQGGGMCLPDSNLLTSNAFSALVYGHITPPQLSLLRLFPIQTVDLNMLLNARYLSTFGQNNLLTPLGIQGLLFGHIGPSQLQSINAYPCPQAAMTMDVLTQARYFTSDCLPTALGLTAIHVGYFSLGNLGGLGCSINDYSQLTLEQFVSARYVLPETNLLTPLGLLAYHVGVISREIYQQYSIFPFALRGAAISTDFGDTDQVGYSSVIKSFITAGYFHEGSNLLTGAGYFALHKEYYTVDTLRTIGLWPCSTMPTMSAFVSAGYATYSGHLTSLGYSLLHANYFPMDWVSRLGCHLHSEYHLFHAAFSYNNIMTSDYHAFHLSAHTEAATSYESVQTVQSQSVASSEVATAGVSAGVIAGAGAVPYALPNK